MSEKKLTRKEILEMIQNNKVTPEEGYRLIRDLQRINSPQTEAKPRGNGKQKLVIKTKKRAEQDVKSAGPQHHGTAAGARPTDIAVIGMSGRWPGAKNLDEFWDNLAGGVDCVTEIPKDRWDMNQFYARDTKLPNKTYCKWSGLLPDIDKFDPLFFNISPREAELMDPQQRLFLEESWRALEDAGYSPLELSDVNCGVFVGATQSDYSHYLRFVENELDAQFLTGMQTSFLSGRISYFLNLTGPNTAVDNACSSSLAAVHLACQSILSGESEMALAGGVFLLTSPDVIIMTSKGGMLSKNGKCKVFDNDADGFVPGEGVGVVVLKPLAQAVKDHDHIYGVIKGSRVNYDGKTNGITAPSANSQTKLEVDVYRTFKINPETISYLEAHGTGTKLGDPIEISALKKAFGNFTRKKHFCTIGSVKANIGHSMPASGLAGLMKILLSLKHNKIVPSLHFNKLNEHIKLQDSPFIINTELIHWKPQAGEPRRAAVSSFGLNGTNCHMVIEEAPALNREENNNYRPYYLIPFSAKTREALNRKVEDMAKWVEKEGNKTNLGDLGYTLGTGRSHFDIRSGLIVKDFDDLKLKLNQIHARGTTEDYFTNTRPEKPVEIDPEEQETGKQLVGQLQAAESLPAEEYKNKLAALAGLYVRGYDPAWKSLYPGTARRNSLPAYPFAGERFWPFPGDFFARNVKSGTTKLHPLIDCNTSTLKEQKYQTTLTGQEFYLTDHVVGGEKMLPAVVYMEMARGAGELAGESKVQKLYNIDWIKPLTLAEEACNVDINLYPLDNQVNFEISSGNENNNRVLHARGKMGFADEIINPPEFIDLEAIKKRCWNQKSGSELYHLFQLNGINFGPGFQTVQNLWANKTEALAGLELPETCQDTFRQFVLHPSLMDGALQTVIGLRNGEEETGTGYLPFTLKELEVMAPLPEKCYAYVTLAGEQHRAEHHLRKFNIRLADQTGRVLVNIKEYLPRPYEAEHQNRRVVEYFRSRWENAAIEVPAGEIPGMSCGSILVFDTPDNLSRVLKERLQGEKDESRSVVLVKPGDTFREIEDKTYEINPGSQDDYLQLLETVKAQYGLPAKIVHLWSQDGFTGAGEALNAQLRTGVYSLFYLSKALIKQKPANRIILLYVFPGSTAGPQPQYAAVSGFANTIRLENPKLIYKTIEIQDAGITPARVADVTTEELSEKAGDDVQIRYQDGLRQVKVLQEIPFQAQPAEQEILKDSGVYLITGGAGGLGLIFAEYLAKQGKTKLVLTGRSELSAEKRARIKDLASAGAEVVYMQADVSRFKEVEELVAAIKSRFEKINGVVHSAGVIRDAFILKKTPEEFAAVLAPKVYGAVNLDEALKEEKLDFFVLFSSLGGVTGNIGQCDYAYANSFMDHFALLRESFRSKGERFGKTLTINWPLWQDGGMNVDEQSKEMMVKKIGMLPLSTTNGLRAFEFGLGLDTSQLVVIEGCAGELKNALTGGLGKCLPQGNITPAQGALEPGDKDEMREKTEEYLKKIISKVIKLPTDRINSRTPFESYGIDSVMIVKLNDELEAHFGELSKTLFFEYQCLTDLAGYFLANHMEELHEKIQLPREEGPEKPLVLNGKKEMRAELYRPRFMGTLLAPEAEGEKDPGAEKEYKEEDIAIIGLSGRYPLCRNVEEFGAALKNGKDCITEIPPERWDNNLYYHPDKENKGKYYSKWGGFIDDVDKFDPLFFNISPREAEIMDPQERLFLETAWHTMEDAGYTRESLEKHTVGVFVGVMYGHYQIFGAEESLKGNVIGLNSSYASIANRVSYYFNLQGPSIALDTMCSSSLTTIHLACDSLKKGECQMALAGGVNLTLHPTKYLLLSQGNFISTDGRCRSFGAGGDGYVPGEGVGAILLKSLSNALQDGDQIYGVIKASSINHGGKTNGYTVPNPNAQSKLVLDALKKSGINPRTISYIEAHGTGTALGDPIEITGLTKAFREYAQDKLFCSIGSVKSNIGHLESAAGIAAVTKVLLQMKYKQLFPSLHAQKQNPNLNLEDSPFYVQQQLEKWEQPVITEDGVEKTYPRRAGISSFGAGGANTHVILEEYQQAENPSVVANQEPQLIILSARNEERLREYAGEMSLFFEKAIARNEDTQMVEKDLAQRLLKDLIQTMGEILDMEHEKDIDPAGDFQEYGFDHVTLAQLAGRINDAFDLGLEPTVFAAHPSPESLNRHLVKEYKDVLIQHLPPGGQGSSQREAGQAINLTDIAYTLQVGREAMEERLAVVVNSVEELAGKLKAFCQQKENSGNLYRGNVKASKEHAGLLIEGKEGLEFIKAVTAAKNLDKLARLWVSGVKIDWQLLYSGDRSNRISLPNYPFAGKRYWVNSYQEKNSPAVAAGNQSEIRQTSSSLAPDPALASRFDHGARTYRGDEVVLQVIDGSIALVTMQDTKNKNMFSEKIIVGLMAKFREIQQNKDIKVVIVTGYDNVFCMGGTQDQLNRISDRKNSFHDVPFLYQGLLECQVPVIAAMQGHASGGGMLFGLYADIVILAEESVYSAVFMKYGFTPGMGATYILKEKLGNNLATEMMFTARSFRGEELKDRGTSIIFRKRKDVLPEAIAIARMLCEKPLKALKVLKKELAGRALVELPVFIERETDMHAQTFSDQEVKRRIQYYYEHKKDDAGHKQPDRQGSGETKTFKRRQILKPKKLPPVSPVKGQEVNKSQSSSGEDSLERLLMDLEEGRITPEEALVQKIES